MQKVFKNWIKKSAPLLSPKVISKPLSWAGMKNAGKVSQPASHKRILSAIRRDDLTLLKDPDENKLLLALSMLSVKN